MRTVGIVLSIIAVLLIAAFVIVQINQPWAIAVRKVFAKIANIEVVDEQRIQELELKIKYLQFERDSILKINENIFAENEELNNIIDERDEYIGILLANIEQQEQEMQDMVDSLGTLTPTEMVEKFDELTGEDLHPSSSLRVDEIVETPIERIEKSTVKMVERDYLLNQTIAHKKIIEELNKNVSDLRIINNNLNNALVQERALTELALRERDYYIELYRETIGKTRVRTIIAYTIVAIETAVIIWIVTGD